VKWVRRIREEREEMGEEGGYDFIPFNRK